MQYNFSNYLFTEHVVMRIETKQAPIPSQPEVVLSDGKSLRSPCFPLKAIFVPKLASNTLFM